MHRRSERSDVVGFRSTSPRATAGEPTIEAFSDGIFATAITLLVVEISVPERDFDNLLDGHRGPRPSYLGYMTSLLTIRSPPATSHLVINRVRVVESTEIHASGMTLYSFFGAASLGEKAARRGYCAGQC